MMRFYHRSQVDFKKYQNPTLKKKSGSIFSFFKHKKKEKIGNKNTLDRPLSNPWRQKPKKNWKNIIALSSALILILFSFGLLFFLPYFQVNKISVVGQKITKPEEVENFIRENYVGDSKNYFLVRSGKIEEGTKEQFGLDKVVITKNFPHEITVNITEKMCSVIVFDGLKYHLLDKSGGYITQILNDIKPEATLIETSPENMSTTTEFFNLDDSEAISTPTTNTPQIETSITYDKPDMNLIRKNSFEQPIILLKDFDQNNITDIIDANTISKIIEWQNIFKEQKSEEIKYFEVEKNNAGIKVFVDRNWYIIFNPDNDLTLQIDNLKTVINEFKPQEYIDLRFGEKIYWK